ncbi:MAG TPA: MraY family glycosyltransferase, partial [Clostridiaceae bacterium]|nr:MraY family glycosyltransferase [Clostridiaceae bacterium]
MSTLFVLAVIAAAISAAATPVVKKIALKLDIIDSPKGKRKIHDKPIPLLGGLAIYFSFMSVMLLKSGALTTHETGIMIGATIIVIGGVIDDTFELRPQYKLIFQISAAVVLIIFGVEISSVTNPLSNGDGYWNVGWMTVPMTILWVIGITNALNLIDGLDGLAAG